MNVTTKPGGRRRFYTLMAWALAVIVVIGFSRSFYLRPWFEVAPLTLGLHLHGATLTLWVILFVVQARSIAAGRRRLHMSFGIGGIALAAIAIATTYAAAIESVRLGVELGGIGIDRLYSNVVLLTLFGSFVGLGAAFRKRPEIHKAFMLLAMIAAIGPAVTRAVALIFGQGIRDSHLPVEAAFVLSALFYCWRTQRRLDWVLLCGGVLLIATQATRRIVGGSAEWVQIGSWLVQ